MRTIKHIGFNLKNSIVRVGYALLSVALPSGVALAQQSSQGPGIATPGGALEPLAVYPPAPYSVSPPVPPQAPNSGSVTISPPVRHEVLHKDNIPLQVSNRDPVKNEPLAAVPPASRAAAPASEPESRPGVVLAQPSQVAGMTAGALEPLVVYPRPGGRSEMAPSPQASGLVTVSPPLQHEVLRSDNIAPVQAPSSEPVKTEAPKAYSPGTLAAAPAPEPESGPAPAPQSSEGAGVPNPPGSVRVGPLAVYPSVRYEVMHNDNVLLQGPGSGLVKSDTIQVLTPSLRTEAKQGAHTFVAGIGATLGRYGASPSDNYNNNNAFASANLNPDTRVRIQLRADYLDAQDPRGSTTDPLTPAPNRYRQQTLGGIFSYGAQGAQGRIELQLGTMGKRYYNNADSGVQSNNRDDNTVGGTFYWRIAPKTSLLAQVRRTGVDFRDDTTSLDSTEISYLAGVTWEATAATTGIVKLGTVRKSFKDAARADASTPSWDAQIQWAPLTYSKWDFILSRAYRETTPGLGDTVVTTNSIARWTHNWTSQITTTATGMYGTDDYKGLIGGRNDKMPSLGLRATYQMRRWLDLGADYTRSSRDSSAESADYRKNVIMLFVNATL